MDKILSLRPTKQIICLFNVIREKDIHPEVERSAIVKRSFDMACNKDIQWENIARFKVKEEDVTVPEHIRFTVDDDQYIKVVESIKDCLDLERLTTPYLIKLVLSNYLNSLNQNDTKVLDVVEQMINIGVDGLVFKNAFECSQFSEKEKLLSLSRNYLENINTGMNKMLRNQMNVKIKQYSDYFNLDKYIPKKRSNFGSCDIRFVSKVLAGLLITVVDTGEYDMSEIINGLESLK